MASLEGEVFSLTGNTKPPLVSTVLWNGSRYGRGTSRCSLHMENKFEITYLVATDHLEQKLLGLTDENQGAENGQPRQITKRRKSMQCDMTTYKSMGHKSWHTPPTRASGTYLQANHKNADVGQHVIKIVLACVNV